MCTGWVVVFDNQCYGYVMCTGWVVVFDSQCYGYVMCTGWVVVFDSQCYGYVMCTGWAIHRFDLVYIPMESPKTEYTIKYWKVNMSRLLM